MPTARRSRTIPAAAGELWELLSDPHHLPRWWPRVERVENVEEHAFTEVMRTSRGRTVRADFDILARDPQRLTLAFSQRVAGTPFARVLSAAETRISLEPLEPCSTRVTIELHQSLHGFFTRFGAPIVRRAAARMLDDALDGLDRVSPRALGQ